MANKKTKTAMLSIVSNSVLIAMKLIVGIISGSVSIISEAIHSGMDLVAAVIAFCSVRVSDNPPDKDHPYGHGKIENISGVIEAVLILVAAGYIIIEAVKKLIHNEPVESLGLGFAVMMVSALVNFFVSRRLYAVAKKEDSIALAADALHLKVDVYTSLGVGVGLFVLWITKLNVLDPVIAILVALFILKEAIDMLRTAYLPLVDTALSDKELELIKETFSRYSASIIDFHELRTRRAGKMKHIDLHLTSPQDMTIVQSHDICDAIERELERKLHHTTVLIHVEPCTHNCGVCTIGQGKSCLFANNKKNEPSRRVFFRKQKE